MGLRELKNDVMSRIFIKVKKFSEKSRKDKKLQCKRLHCYREFVDT